MTESEWLASTDLEAMLSRVCRCNRSTDRVLWLFGCACGRRLWHLCTDTRCHEAVELTERFADGEAEAEELASAGDRARAAYLETRLGSGVLSPALAVAWFARRLTQPATGESITDAIFLLPG